MEYIGLSENDEIVLYVQLSHNGREIYPRIRFPVLTFPWESSTLTARDLYGYATCRSRNTLSHETCYKFRNGFYELPGDGYMTRFPELEITKVRAVKARLSDNNLVFTFEEDRKSGRSKKLLQKFKGKMRGRGGAGPSGS
ncbi:hypothetical protein DFJ43DRAFT_1136527 [Lentinula guzmanii]|uniref:Uncharacterized protein n=1 Tax=Lentinula guzmanii TaxID=2804957 RepID=A0AA38N300_9AGAR|nr:hypothetical protein DFJ43DRAFT_1136527 [Lentinula guzmanii]